MKAVIPLRSSGFSLVEMMVAMTLSLVLIAGVISLFVSSKKSYTESERFARIQENGRFAMFTLEQELRLARFFGSVRAISITDNGSLGAVSNDCTGNGAAYDYNAALAATTSDGSGNAYGCITDAVPNTSVLVVKHVRPEPITPDSSDEASNKTYVLANHDIGQLYDGADTAPTVAVPGYIKGAAAGDENVPAQSWEYQASVYYIRNATTPTLSRKTLQMGAGGSMAMVTEDMISGIENMALQFGVDSNNNGDIDTFVTAATLNVATTYNWDDVGAVRIALLVRGEEQDPFFTDNKTYNLGAGIPPVSNPNDHFHRTVISGTLSLRNPLFIIREDGT